MAIGLIDMDSCGDALTFSAGTQTPWTESSGGGPQMSTAYGTFGGYGFRCQGSGQQIRRNIAQTTRLIFGLHINIPQVGGTIWIRENSIVHAQVNIRGDTGQVVLRNGASSVTYDSTPVDTFIGSTWWYGEVDVLIHDTLGEMRLWMFGSSTPVLELTGLDTKNGGSGYINNLKFCGAHLVGGDFNGTFDWDDMYMIDGTVPGSARLGPCRVTARYPNSDGAPSEWDPSVVGPHWPMVSERPFSAADWVQTNVNGERDMFGMPTDGLTFNVHGIRVIGQVRKNDVLAAQARLTIKDGANYGNGALRNLSDTSTIYGDTFAERPAGAGAWDVASVDGVLIGAEKVT